MKKILLIFICLCSISITAKTRYVAFNDISYSIEIYDSLNRVSYEHMFTHENYLTKNVGDIQVTTCSIPVSDQENKAIKNAKTSTGLATVAMAASIASTVVDIATPHRYGFGYRHSWWYYNNRLVFDSMNLMFSASLYDKAVAALNDLKNFEGTAIVISNNAIDIKTVIVNNEQYYIGPKDSKAFNLHKDGAVVIIKNNGSVTKIITNATRIVKKIPYTFADEEYYYRKAKIDGETIYQRLPKNNVQESDYIEKEVYERLRKK